MPPDRGEARLECIRHDVGRQHANRMRPQMGVKAVAKPARHEMLCDVAMRDLSQRMNTGIGAPGAMDADLLTADRLDRLLKGALNRGAVFLNLPAAERTAIIFDDQFIARHQLSRVGGPTGVPRKNSST